MRACIDRRTVVGGLAAAATGARGALAASPPLPKAPVALNVIDVGGALALMQKASRTTRPPSPSSSRASPT